MLLDIDGVLSVSWRAVPGGPEALDRIRARGGGLRFLTNTTSRTRTAVAAALAEAGYTVAPEEIETAATATAAHLASHHPRARCLVANEGPLDDLGAVTLVAEDDPPDSADVVVVGSAGPSFTWELVNRLARAVLGGAAFVAMHGGTRWRTTDGICVDGGAFVAAVESATGAVATVVGKPAPAMFEHVLADLGIAAGDAVMIGDDPDVDVGGAVALGIPAVLVRTGKFGGDASDVPDADAVLDSLVDVPAWLEG